MSITHQVVIGEDGQPTAVIIPWDVFMKLRELVDVVEATPEELEAIREAEADRREGNDDAFTDLKELKAELSL